MEGDEDQGVSFGISAPLFATSRAITITWCTSKSASAMGRHNVGDGLFLIARAAAIV